MMAGDQAGSGKDRISLLLRAVKGKVMRPRTRVGFGSQGALANVKSAERKPAKIPGTGTARPPAKMQRFTVSLGSVLTGIPDIPPSTSPLSSDLLYLRAPTRSDYQQWITLRAASADYLRPWEPLWPADDLTSQGFRRRLEMYQKDSRSGRALPLLIFRHEDNRLIGGINVSNIRRGICQSASIGYWMGEDFAGQGYMTRAVALLLPYLFDCQGLHRVEAACLPTNEPSMAVLKKCGFQFEGKARRYLCINGRWEDHYLYSVLRSDLPALD